MTTVHKQKLTDMREKLGSLGSKESTFTAVEILFYEAIEIARSYGNDQRQNPFLAELKKIQGGQYSLTKEHFKKSSQRELVIRKFISSLRNALKAAIENDQERQEMHQSE